MRALTTEQSTVLTLPVRSTSVKVEIAPTTAGPFTDLTNVNVNGYRYNLFKHLSYKDSVDDTSMTAEITIARKVFDLTTPPLMTGSFLNAVTTLINLNYCVRISVAVVPFGVQAVLADYTQIFFGRVYDTNWAGQNDFVLSCHDYCGELLSLWYYQRGQAFSNLTTGVAIETVMQQLLDEVHDNQYTTGQPFLEDLYSINGSAITPFNPADSPGASTWLYTQDQMPLYTALQNLSQNVGWLLKQRWQTTVGSFQLLMFDPMRSNVTSTWTFPSSQYYDVTQIGLNLAEIRNLVAIYFTDLTGNSNTIVSPSGTYPNAGATASQAAYGAQFMQLAQEATTGINTTTDALNLATRSLSDLAQPQVTVQVKTPYFWPVEVCDVYTLKANGEHFDNNQVLAIVAHEHDLPVDGPCTSTLSFRGKPTGGIKTWFDRQTSFVRKLFGVNNSNINTEMGSPNGNFGQSSRG